MTESEHRVTPLELFFDLVFVFALTQVTGSIAGDPTWMGLAEGMLVLAALWWAWGAYAWLTNTIDPEESGARIALFATMAAMMVAALAVPGAFGDDALLFGCAYFVVRVMHIVLYAQRSHDVDIRNAVMRLGRTAIPAPALLVAAGLAEGDARLALWLVALALDYGGPYVFGVRGLTLAPAHFAERYGLVMIIALGESIVAVGVGAAGEPLDLDLVVAAVLGIAVAASLWWAYFDVLAVIARTRLQHASGYTRVKMARDAYSLLHLPMIAGVVLVAVGIKQTLSHLDEPLGTVPAVALCCGFALYLAGHAAFAWRTVGSVKRQRLATAAVGVALLAVTLEVDALVALAAVTALGAALAAYETVRFREARDAIRAAETA